MSFDKLGDHIWIHILTFLTPSTPKPLSGLTKEEAFMERDSVRMQLPDAGAPGVTSRGDIRAPEIVTLMRVSIAFYRLASVSLYRTIITDDLPCLLNHRDQPPAHPAINSKDQLFRFTTNLLLEYKRKGTAGVALGEELRYEHLMTTPECWHVVGRTEIEIALLQCCSEAERLYHITFASAPLMPSDATPFPALEQVSVAAIFGGQGTLWDAAIVQKRIMESVSEELAGKHLHDVLGMTHGAMVASFCPSPITHWCQRGLFGPLSLPTTFSWADRRSPIPSPHTPCFTFHFAADRSITRVPAAMGHAKRWLLDVPVPGTHVGNLGAALREALGQVQGERDQLCLELRQRPAKPTLQISISASTASLLLPPPLRSQRRKGNLWPVVTNFYGNWRECRQPSRRARRMMSSGSLYRAVNRAMLAGGDTSYEEVRDRETGFIVGLRQVALEGTVERSDWRLRPIAHRRATRREGRRMRDLVGIL